MKLYDNYTNQIANALNFDSRIVGQLNLSESKKYFTRSSDYTSGLFGETGLKKLADLLGVELKTPTFGDHPDFKHIRETGSFEYYPTTSVFHDVKGSTAFFKKYTKEQIYIIIQTITLATTHTFSLFEGHIQRLQYDGVFSYFVKKNVNEKVSLFQSLCATSFASYFVRYELKPLFIKHGFDRIFVRTGIDFGKKNDVMWVVYGINGCSEVSTNSLHTSLAFKIQKKAYGDKICVGENVVDQLPELRDYFKPHTDSSNMPDDKISSHDYRLFDFDWEKFLPNYFDFIQKDFEGNLTINYAYADKPESELKRIADLMNERNLARIAQAYVTSKGIFTQIKTENPIPKTNYYAE